MERNFVRVICVDESDPMEYKILEDVNKGTLDEVHTFLEETYYKHIGSGIRWLLLPAIVTI